MGIVHLTAGTELTQTEDDATNRHTVDNLSKNAIINGCFRVSQRGTSFTSATIPANSDDTYLLDRWILLSDGNDIVDVSQETDATIANPSHNIKLDVETANKKFGIITILEQKDSRRFIGQTVSLSFKAKITGTTINAIRAAVLSWSSTADTVTSDVVNAWGGAGTNPTVVANWNLENTPAALTAPTTSWATYKIEGIAIDTASATNIAVFIWTDDVTMDIGDFLHIADVQLEIGSVATAFEFRPYQQELDLCQRYCYVPLANNPYDVFGNGYINADAGLIAFIFVPLPVTMRIAPTFTVTTVGSFALQTGAATITALTDLTQTRANYNSSWLSATVGGDVGSVGDGCFLVANNQVTERFSFTAEL